MIAASQLRTQRTMLIRYRRSIAYSYAIAHHAGDMIAMDAHAFEFKRLTANIDVLTRWLEELRLSEQARPALREVQRILNHHL